MPLFPTAPVAPERLHQIITRLMLHYRIPAEQSAEAIFQQYSLQLQHYPEDLLCAAYVHMVRHYAPATMPPVSEFIAFMEPEMQRRNHVTS